MGDGDGKRKQTNKNTSSSVQLCLTVIRYIGSVFKDGIEEALALWVSSIIKLT